MLGRARSQGSGLDLQGTQGKAVSAEEAAEPGDTPLTPLRQLQAQPAAFESARATIARQQLEFAAQVADLHRLLSTQHALTAAAAASDDAAAAAGPGRPRLGLKLDLAQLARPGAARADSGAAAAAFRAASGGGARAAPSRSGGSTDAARASADSGSGDSGGVAPSGGASTGGAGTPRLLGPAAPGGAARAAFPHPMHAMPPPPPLSAAAAARDPFLVAAAGAAAAGRAWGEGADRVALLGRRWYAQADYPSGAGGAHPAQLEATASERPATFTKPPRLTLRPDGTTAPAEPRDGDGDPMPEAPPRKPARPRAPRAASGAAAGAAASGARGAPTGGSGVPHPPGGAWHGAGEAASARWGPASAAAAAVAAALAAPSQWPALPAATLSALMQVPMTLPPAAARRALAGSGDGGAAAAAARVPTAPRSRPAKRPSDAAAAVAAAEADAARASAGDGPAAELARVVALARRPSNRARDGGRVPGPGAGLTLAAARAGGAKAAPPSFAFEVLPRLVPLSRADVAADLKAIADGAEALFFMASRAEPGAKRLRVA